jgi:uncharacterized protein YkwD
MNFFSAWKTAGTFCGHFALFVFVSALLTASVNAQSAARPDRLPSSGQTSSAQIPQNERALFESLNHERTSRGLTALLWDTHLAAAAQLHAQRMAETNNLSHQLPGEPELLARLSASGARFSSIAENIAAGSDTSLIHDGWMHSPGHRANILDPRNTAVGIAVVRGRTQLFAVQDFSRAVETLDLEQQEKKVSVLLAAHGLKVEDKFSEARKNCDANVGISGVTTMSLIRFDASDLAVLPDGVQKKIEARSFQRAALGACPSTGSSGFAHYRIVILLF